MFDLQPYTGIDWSAESQMVEGGVNKFDNCVPTAFMICGLFYGIGDIEPQDWIDAEYSPTYHGGTDFGHAIDFLNKRWPSHPDIRVSNPRDTIAAIDAAGKAGFPMVIQAHCDLDAAFVDHQTGYFHMGVPVALDNTKGTVLIRNVYWGKLHELSFDFVKKMTLDPAGWSAVFAKSLVPVAPSPDPKDIEIAQLNQQLGDLSTKLSSAVALVAKREGQMSQAVKDLVL